jgi:hypothetical protein
VAELAKLLTTIPSWMVILLLVGVLLLAAEVLVLLFVLLRPLAVRMGKAKKISLGITGANIQLANEDKADGDNHLPAGKLNA